MEVGKATTAVTDGASACAIGPTSTVEAHPEAVAMARARTARSELTGTGPAMVRTIDPPGIRLE